MVEIVGHYPLSDAPPGYVLHEAAKAWAEDYEQRLQRLNVVVRSIRSASDLHLVIDSTVEVLRHDLRCFPGWDCDDVRAHINNVLLSALQTGLWTILYAVNGDDTDFIYGYLVSCRDTNEVLTQYTKFAYRKFGIQSKYLMPFGLDLSKQRTYQWGTKTTLKMHYKDKDMVKHRDFLSERGWALLKGHNLLTPEESVQAMANLKTLSQ